MKERKTGLQADTRGCANGVCQMYAYLSVAIFSVFSVLFLKYSSKFSRGDLRRDFLTLVTTSEMRQGGHLHGTEAFARLCNCGM